MVPSHIQQLHECSYTEYKQNNTDNKTIFAPPAALRMGEKSRTHRKGRERHVVLVVADDVILVGITSGELHLERR